MKSYYDNLIKERKDEIENMNMNKINLTPFSDKINKIKATVERQLRQLRELEHQAEEWRHEQEEQQKINKEYEQSYEDFFTLPSEQQIYNFVNEVSFMPTSKKSLPISISTTEKRIEEANKQPFGTVIKLDDLTDDDKIEMGKLLKEFYEDNIKSLPTNNKVLVGYFINGEWIYRPLDNEQVKNSLEKMLDGNYVFSADEIKTIGSDTEINISLSFIDAIQFKLVEKHKDKNERSGNSSAFFPYRLKQEWKHFKVFLKRYQIGCNLYSFKHQKPNNGLIIVVSFMLSLKNIQMRKHY